MYQWNGGIDTCRWTPMPDGVPAGLASPQGWTTRTTPSWTGVASSLSARPSGVPSGRSSGPGRRHVGIIAGAADPSLNVDSILSNRWGLRWTRLLGQDRSGIERESRCFRFLRQSIPSPVEHLGSGPVAQGLMWPLVVEPEVAPKPKPRWDVHFQGGQWYGRTALRLRDKDTVGHPGSGSQCATNVDSTLASV